VRGSRPRRGAARCRARRGCRRLRPRRRRLDVPLRRLLERARSGDGRGDGARPLVVVPAAVRRALEAHAEAEAPNEACGLLVLRDGVAEDYLPCINDAASPYRFELRPRDPMDFFLEDEGYE